MIHEPNVLVIGSGGSKGLSILGALDVYYNHHLLNNITEFWGTSIGSIISFLLLIEYNNKYSKIFKLFIDQSQKYLLKTNKINNQLRKLLLKNNLLDLSQLIIPYLIEMISIDNKYTIPKDYIKTWSITKEYYKNAIIIDPKLIDLELKKPELNKLIKFLELSITQEKNYKNIINNVNKFIQYYNNIKNNN